MKSSKTAFAILALSLFSFSLFSSQKTISNGNSQKADTVNVKKVTVNGNEVNLPTVATLDNIDFLMKEKKAVIYHYGFAPVYNPEFEKKYGVKIVNQGCVVMPGENNESKNNNLIVADFLTKNFGEAWKKELSFSPFGTK